jgi:hypothetical protein
MASLKHAERSKILLQEVNIRGIFKARAKVIN